MYIKLINSFNLNSYALFCPRFKTKQILEILVFVQFFIKPSVNIFVTVNISIADIFLYYQIMGISLISLMFC
jgi:hypothetical protein